MLDAFQISTYNGKEKTLNEMKDKHIFEYLEGLDNEFEYNCEITETYPDNNYQDKKKPLVLPTPRVRNNQTNNEHKTPISFPATNRD